MESNGELQAEEIEVLQSIYDGDPNFKQMNSTTYQYKFGEEGEKDSVLIEIQWPAEYPESVPIINLGTFYNQHLSATAKSAFSSALKEEAEKNVGTQLTYTLIEWARENYQPVLSPHLVEGLSTRAENLSIKEDKDDDQQSKVKVKKEQLSKSQKRKEWSRMDAKGEKIRGWDWVDVIKHLSQSGGKQQFEDASATSSTRTNPSAPKGYLSAADLPD